MSLTVRPKRIFTCGNCQKKAEDMYLCGNCKEIEYCSKECQTAAWKIHKEFCSTRKIMVFADVAESMNYSIPQSFLKNFGDYEKFLETTLSASFSIAKKSPTYGLKNHSTLVNTHVKKRNLKPILLHIHGEQDKNFTVKWLKATVSNWPHPLLYLALGHAIFDTINDTHTPKEKEDLLAKSSAYKITCVALTTADCACYSDNTTKLIAGCFFGRILKGSPEEDALIMDQNLFQKKITILLRIERDKLLKNIDRLVSPAWIVIDQMKYFFKKPQNHLPPAECRQIRKDFLKTKFID
jgi:hypothetical protein